MGDQGTGDRPEARTTDPPESSTTGWERLHPATVRATALAVGASGAAAGVPTTIGLLLGGVGWGWTVLWVIGGIAVITAASAAVDLVRRRSVVYRITDQRVEYRFHFLVTKRSSLPRDRIRTVELTADPAQRLFTVAGLRIGTGEQGGDDLVLRSIGRELAERLRRELIPRAGPAGDHRPGEMARFAPAWIRFAPISIWTPVLGGAAFGVALNVASWFNAAGPLLQRVQGLFDGMSLLAEIAVLAVAGLLIGAVVNLAIFAEGWWNYRLIREDDGSLHIRRGLLIQRSTTFELARVRGLTVARPLGIRLAGAAKLDILATGLRRSDESRTADPDTLLPPAPMAVALRVARDVLGLPTPAALPPTLVTHPAAATRRRYLRATAAVVGILAVLVVLGAVVHPVLTRIALILALPLAAAGWWCARDNAAALGHGVTGEQLYLRSGSIGRRTAVLHRRGLIGWRLRQSPLQRRSGLVTAFAGTAAGNGQLRLPDAGVEQAGRLLTETAPEWQHLVAARQDQAS